MIKIGIIGMSPGNAHPSSWSSIINGDFDGGEIDALGFPAVTTYLKANRATLGLPNARVTHIWAQDQDLAKQIAKTADIKNTVVNYQDMIGKVDAVILARDDAENHREIAKPFIDAGVPIFIDKPLCSNQKDLDYFTSEIAKGKLIMSCSSMRYAAECMTAKTDLLGFGEIKLITAVGKKDWIKYGVHILEAIFSVLDDPKPISVINTGKPDAAVVTINFENGLPVVVNLFMDIAGPFQFSVFGEKNWKLYEIRNSYSMFRNNIIEFIRSVEEGKARLDFTKTKQIIKVLMAGEESLKQGGKLINIS